MIERFLATTKYVLAIVFNIQVNMHVLTPAFRADDFLENHC